MMIEFESVTKIFGNGTKALEDISFSVGKDEFVIIQGKTGAGKTTIMRLMVRDLPFEEGAIRVDGDDITKISKKNIPLLRRKVGVVFQDFKLLMDRTVEENIALTLDILDLDSDIVSARIKELLALTGLEGKGEMFPSQLSGGELQRVVIARALAPQPKIVFADEPTGNLDKETGWQIIELLKDINSQGTAVVLATHDTSIINKLNDRIIELEKGKIIKDTGSKKKQNPKKESTKPTEEEKEKVDESEKSDTKEEKEDE